MWIVGAINELALLSKPPKMGLPMLWPNIHSVDINSILEPSFFFRYLYIVPTHLSLLHETVMIKGPVLKSVASPPLTVVVTKFIPELNSDLIHTLA